MVGNMADNNTRDVSGDDIVDPHAGLLDDLAALVEGPRYRPGPPCYVSVILAQLGDRAEKVKPFLDNPNLAGALVAGLLAKYGFTVSSQTVLRHRRRGKHNGCRCPK